MSVTRRVKRIRRRVDRVEERLDRVEWARDAWATGAFLASACAVAALIVCGWVGGLDGWLPW
ncbi:hypothetical protein AB1L88_15540 [Tautonia sp. JC769]|uniref:hypothetical protein n=1 Tax=Tautonia sp. JC769 TaxID=3232135 RepID=UPI0034595433